MSINGAVTASAREARCEKRWCQPRKEVHDARVGSCVEGVEVTTIVTRRRSQVQKTIGL